MYHEEKWVAGKASVASYAGGDFRRDSGKFVDVKNVYTIIFYEKSPAEFRKALSLYVHHGSQTIDSGVELDSLQKYVFVSLDSFFKIYENKKELSVSSTHGGCFSGQMNRNGF